MPNNTADGATTAEVALRWFNALSSGDIDAALELAADDIEFVNYTPVPGYNTDMPWIGTHLGRDAVRRSFEEFGRVVAVDYAELIRIAVDRNSAAGVIREISTVRETGLKFEIEFVQWLTVQDGKIVYWKSYTDPSEILRALRGPVLEREVSA
ncbi:MULTISPECIES: nuclear transport factor 2 family protein [Actinoalloteichus]|uniref:Ketosteroid isomerase-like protein n=1 Tax=Actinoalloteichus fjordicus TaxID=1612552 RepID=A0AAC9PQV0_9PSEU|nr:MULTISPECIES: nuclear transport factor 2 family protein [Actinoalloteichus]APU13579.1 ketosteroid isomerase-like protein [Actinoalloteichus fjordicus]APU19526.1 ketosteroid isomerase-like protein [Actinoalloteichus sp. GBA129-24]